MKYQRGRPNGNGQRNATVALRFDGNVCKCGRLLPAEYPVVDGVRWREVRRICVDCVKTSEILREVKQR